VIDLAKRRWGRHFSDKEIATARKTGRLLTMEIETSHLCNLRCIYCYNSSGKKRQNELGYREIANVIEQAMDLGVQRIIIIGGGEPLMHPHITKIISFIHKKNLGIDLFTNGTLIDEKMARFLHDHGVEPVVKMNSLNPKIQDMLTQKTRTFDRIQRGMEHLLQAGYPDKEGNLGVETIICSYNYHEIPRMWEWARERDIIPYFEMITFQGRARKRRDLNVPVRDLKVLFENLAALDREKYGFKWEPHPPIAALSCSRHEYSCTIDSRGYVQPCTGVDLKVGNIRYDSLKNILQGSVIIQCLRNIRRNIKGSCRTCDLVYKCYGCRGLAYHLTGDFLAPDPLCWKNPKHLRISKTKEIKKESCDQRTSRPEPKI